MVVIQAYRDGRYAWRCEDCGRPRLEMAHRGPRKSVCKACQNNRYRRLGGDALRERNRYRMRLRRTRPGRAGQEGTIAGPEQRCFPPSALGPTCGRAGLVHCRQASLRRPASSRHGTPCRLRPLAEPEQTPTRRDPSTQEIEREPNG